MRSILIYISFFFYMVATLFLKVVVNYKKKRMSKEDFEVYLHGLVLNWSRRMLKIAGVKIEVKGVENLPKQNCLFVCNHQGNFDFFVLLAGIDKPMGFIAKKEILKLRIASGWMREMHCVFIDRTNIRESLKAINEGADNLNNGYSMVIFPEGTRSKGHKIGEFKKGSMKLASKAKDVPIVPLTIDGTYKIFEDGHGWLKKGTVSLTIGKSFKYSELQKENQGNLAEYCETIIKNQL